MDPLRNIIYILFILVAVVVIILICVYYLIKRSRPDKDIPDAPWQGYSSFRNSVKSCGLSPEKVISYGKTSFAYEDEKILIQTGQNSEGMVLSSGDIASFELFRDNKAIEAEAVKPEFGVTLEPEHIKRSCFDLHITITLTNGSEIILPLIDSPAQYEYVYSRALDVANEITAVLKEIINKQL